MRSSFTDTVTPEFDRKYDKYPGAPQKIKVKPICFHTNDFNSKSHYRISSIMSILYMCIVMGEIIPGKQDGFSMIIEGHPILPPPNIIFFTMSPIYEKPDCS